jgi:hypothetical protein
VVVVVPELALLPGAGESLDEQAANIRVAATSVVVPRKIFFDAFMFKYIGYFNPNVSRMLQDTPEILPFSAF